MNATCPRCAWPADGAVVLSRHLTADGIVTYRRCVCGSVLVDAPVAPATLVTAATPARA